MTNKLAENNISAFQRIAYVEIGEKSVEFHSDDLRICTAAFILHPSSFTGHGTPCPYWMVFKILFTKSSDTSKWFFGARPKSRSIRE